MSEKTNPILTIGMATYDDFDGVYFTIQAMRLHQKLCNTDQVEFVVVDNNPTSKSGEAVKKFIERDVNGKYIAYEGQASSFTKYKVADYASGKYVLIVDCHVILVPDAIQNLLEYYQKNPECKNLVQGPLLYDNLTSVSTSFHPKWSGHMWGVWHTDKEQYEKGEPFEIPMQGMGLLSFEKEFWPGINPAFKGFGAEEGYIAERFRQNGGKNICLPSLKWNHRFGRPLGVAFRLILEDRIYNYFLGWMDINPEHEMIQSIYDYFKGQIKEESVIKIKQEAKKTIEQQKQKTQKTTDTETQKTQKKEVIETPVFNIGQNGIWITNIKTLYQYDNGLWKGLNKLQNETQMHSIVEFGAGLGEYIQKYSSLGLPCEAYDGNPYIEQLTDKKVKILDCTKNMPISNFNCVLSLDVGGCIPEEKEQLFIDNICKHSTKWVILSWPNKNENGMGYVNTRENQYIINKFTEKSFLYQEKISKELRSFATLDKFKNSIMVFKTV